MEETKKIKIEQDTSENLNVELKQQPWDSININTNLWNLGTIYTKNTWITYVELLNKKDFNVKTSDELNIISKSVTSLWIISILFWEFNIRISQFLWIQIQWNNEILKWILWIILVMEIILLLIYFYRDTKKLKIEKVDENIWIKKELKYLKEKLKKEESISRKKKIEENILEIKNYNEKIWIQIFQKNIIFYLLKFTIPLFIWYIWIKSIWVSKIKEVLCFIQPLDIIVWILFSAIIYFSFFKKLK